MAAQPEFRTVSNPGDLHSDSPGGFQSDSPEELLAAVGKVTEAAVSTGDVDIEDVTPAKANVSEKPLQESGEAETNAEVAPLALRSTVVPPSGKPLPAGNDWFSNLFGYQEGGYDDAKSWLHVLRDSPDALCFLRSFVSGKQFCVGFFETPSLGELRTRGAMIGSQFAGKLKVRNELGDVSMKHAQPENRHSTFQVASQFNCLEFVGPKVVPEDGITGYVRDKTQGPACSIACGPATAYRNYFVPVDADGRASFTNAVQEGQSRKRQIDNLADFSKLVGNSPPGRFFEVTGGYSMASEEQLRRLNDALKQFTNADRLDELRSSIRIGVHSEVQVTSCNWGVKLVSKPEQVVNQVFASACAVAYNRSTKRDSWKEFASLVLEASYEALLWATLMAAARHEGGAGSRRVFLTCLGGGVFGNSLEWITRAMDRAFSIFKNVDLDVRIITYSGSVDPRLQALEKKYSSK